MKAHYNITPGHHYHMHLPNDVVVGVRVAEVKGTQIRLESLEDHPASRSVYRFTYESFLLGIKNGVLKVTRIDLEQKAA